MVGGVALVPVVVASAVSVLTAQTETAEAFGAEGGVGAVSVPVALRAALFGGAADLGPGLGCAVAVGGAPNAPPLGRVTVHIAIGTVGVLFAGFLTIAVFISGGGAIAKRIRRLLAVAVTATGALVGQDVARGAVAVALAFGVRGAGAALLGRVALARPQWALGAVGVGLARAGPFVTIIPG
jgi:hypothetical protein